MEENVQLQTMDETGTQTIDYVEIATGVVSAYLSHNRVPVAELPGLLASVHAALVGLGQDVGAAEPAVERLTPAQIRKSIRPDALISFIDGKPYKTLKRHLTKHGLTINAYRDRFGLPRDYPTTAASYSAARSALARQTGLGRKDGSEKPSIDPVGVNRIQRAS